LLHAGGIASLPQHLRQEDQQRQVELAGMRHSSCAGTAGVVGIAQAQAAHDPRQCGKPFAATIDSARLGWVPV
jgi:hypothetical protein